jgi:hypothetical protein
MLYLAAICILLNVMFYQVLFSVRNKGTGRILNTS